MSAVEQTLTERGTRYGTFMDNAVIAQHLKGMAIQGGSWDQMKADQREAIEVIFQKISRILTGDPDYVDNWHDIQGYAKLVEDRLIASRLTKIVETRKAKPHGKA
jgi:hypothetical protein